MAGTALWSPAYVRHALHVLSPCSPYSFHTVIHTLCAQMWVSLCARLVDTSARAGLLLDPVGEFCDLGVDRASFGHQRADLAVRVDDRCVVAAAEQLADLGQGQVGELPAQVHRDMP